MSYSSVCAVVDCQGFQFKDRFVPKEVAIISENLSQCQELDMDKLWRVLSLEDQKVCIYTTKFINGLHHYPFNPREFSYITKAENIGQVLCTWYQMVASQDKPLFAFKNQQLGKILNDLDIPSLNLDSIKNFPTVEQIQTKYGDNYLCAYHKRPSKTSNVLLTCAYRKSAQIYREINEIVSADYEKM